MPSTVELTEREKLIAELAWRCGYAYRARLSLDAAAELLSMPYGVPRDRTYYVQRRRDEMDRVAAAAYAREGRREWLGRDNGGWAP